MVASAEELLRLVDLKDSEIQQIIQEGKLVRGTLDSLSDRELACYFAFCIDAAPSELTGDLFFLSEKKTEIDDNVTAIGNIETGELWVFAEISLPASMIKMYQTAKPGSDLNLSKEEIQIFKSLKKSEEVQKAFHKVLHERYKAYKEKGLQGIAPYLRSGNKTYLPGDELKEKAIKAKVLKQECPEFYQCMIDYPHSKPEGLRESYSWQSSVLDDVVTIALVHKMGMKKKGGTFVFSQRHFYVSRSHNSVVGIGGAFACDEGNKTTLVYATRTSTDRVGGFGGAAKRAMGSRIMGSKIAENFERIQKIYKK